jgi:hypothetical protein
VTLPPGEEHFVQLSTSRRDDCLWQPGISCCVSSICGKSDVLTIFGMVRQPNISRRTSFLGSIKKSKFISHANVSPRLSYDHHLLNLPSDLYREIFQYLLIDDLGNLDLALLKRQLREVYLSTLSGMIIPKSMEDCLSPSDKIYSGYLNMWLSQRKIRFRNLRIWHTSHPPSDVAIILQSKPNMETLQLSELDDRDLGMIGHCPRLKSFSLSRRNKTSHGMEQFLRMNPQLERLTISGFNDRFLGVISDACPLLQHLYLRDCDWMRNYALDFLVTCPLKLKSLDIRKSKVTRVKIRALVENPPPDLRFLHPPSFDLETHLLVVNKFVLPSIHDSDHEVQLLALNSLWDEDVLDHIQSSNPPNFLLSLLIQFLSPEYDLVSPSVYPSFLLFPFHCLFLSLS